MQNSQSRATATVIKSHAREEYTLAVTTMAATAEERTQEQILDLIVQQDDISWKQIIFNLIETEQMDPWDINISLISQRFLEELKKLKEMDFRISGKVVLASAILLKMKADKLHTEELAALDSLIHSAEEPIDLGLDLDLFEESIAPRQERPKLIPRTPQPRKRKVSLYELVEALEKALETEVRRPPKRPERTIDKIDPPDSSFKDISEIIKEVYQQVYDHYETAGNDQGTLMFHHILRSEDPRDKVMAFLPLLHLENSLKVEMEQPEHFGPITIHLRDKTPPDLEQFSQRKE